MKELSQFTAQQSVDFEEAVLGAILLENDALFGVYDILRAESFYDPNHQIIYRAISALHEKRMPVDILTVTKEVQAMNQLATVGGAYFISSLTNRIASSANIEYHARIIQQNYILREIAFNSSYIYKKSFQNGVDAFELQEESMSRIDKITSGIVNTSIKTLKQIKDQVIEELNLSLHTNKMSGITTGITALDEHTNGWQNGRLIILAGRPGMGKTSAALCFGISAAKAGHPVAFYSLEMTNEELVSRALAIESGIPSQKVVQKTVKHSDIDKIHFESKAFDTLPFYMDETPELTMVQLRSSARRMKREKNIELIIIDYMQIMKGVESAKHREREISEISRSLKVLARELNIPIIALSQLSRNVETRNTSEKEPALTDLRESGSIEQDADMVIFCHRPEYYRDSGDYSIGANTYDIRGLFIFIIAKFRGGALGKIKARWVGWLTKVMDYNREDPTETKTETSNKDLPF
jgi:replicative DNA helicase